MKRLSFLVVLLCNILVLSAQDIDKKYLAGAVPEVDGKVVFKKSIAVSKDVTKEKLFGLVEQWADKEYGDKNKTERTILLTRKEENYLACKGDDIIFNTGLFNLQKVIMSYQLVVRVELGVVGLEVRNIRYYSIGENKEILQAEKMITDKVALNKEGDKLSNYYGSYRTSTIDHVDALEKNILAYLTQVKKEEVVTPVATSSIIVSEQEDIVSTESRPTASSVATVINEPVSSNNQTVVPTVVVAQTGLPNDQMQGYKLIDAEQLPGNIIKLLKDSWSLIASGKGDKTNVMTASWGGLGRFWEKPVSMCFINPTRHSISTMNNGETYTISFYTEMYRDKLQYCGSTSGKNTDKIKGAGLTPIITPSGATAFSEAWMVIECRKIIAQPISESGVVDKELSKKWSKDGYHMMYMGEILNVWVK